MVLSKLDVLSVRPPTPPEDCQDFQDDETLEFLSDPFGEKAALSRRLSTKSSLGTPVPSPSSDISIPPSSASTRKRVNFELHSCTTVPNKIIAETWSPNRSSPLRPLPHARLSVPLKSILKASDDICTPPPANEAAAAHKFKSFAEMLESIVKLLASAERVSRMDAYNALKRTMEAYNNIPDRQALRQKMTLLSHFIRRDAQASGVNGTGHDSQLVIQALKLMMALLRIPDLVSAMEDDFCSSMVDLFIHTASDDTMPKSIVNTSLAVLMQQSFRPKIMTAARVEKIIGALDTIHERVSGYSVQAYRIRIYRRLIQQRPDVMAKHTDRWFKHTVKALVSGQKDINQSALETALTAAKTLSHDRHVARSVLAILNRVRGDGHSIAWIMAQEMERMLSGDHAALVPQIWSVVTVLMRDYLNSQAFTAMKEWLQVFEKCLKCDKEQVKVHANVAFSFLLVAVDLTTGTVENWSKTSEGWRNMFLKIPLHQLQQRAPMKKTERDAVTSGYISLLYYAFRPTASFEQLDYFWSDFVASFWTSMLSPNSTQQAIAACRVVCALVNGSRKPWNDQRALDLRPQYMIQRAELPLLDPKWVRRSLPLVLEFVQRLLDAIPWYENEQHEDAPVKSMWLAILDSLAEASNKEIMASSESKEAMAHIVNLLRRLWNQHTANLALSQDQEDLWADKFCFLIEVVVQKLGALHFSEKCLVEDEENDFEVVCTSSYRSRERVIQTSPLLYLVDLLIIPSEGRLADHVRLRALKLVIEPCFFVQKSRVGRLGVLRDCASATWESPITTVAQSFWRQIATLLLSTMSEEGSNTNERTSRSLGKEYEIIVEIIKLGSSYLLNTPQGDDVLLAFIALVRHEAGEGALVDAVVESVSERVINQITYENKVSSLSFVSILLQNLPQNLSRRILKQSRQILWPSSLIATRNLDFDPYDHFYAAINSVGSAAYHNMSVLTTEHATQFLAGFATSVRQCQASHLVAYLRQSQEMIRFWVEDPAIKLGSNEPPFRALHKEVVTLWQEIWCAIGQLPRKDSQLLAHLESLTTAGFSSRRRSVLNISVETWNESFGKQEVLQYPSRLEKALRQLNGKVELSLPSLPIQNDVDNDFSLNRSDTSVGDAKHLPNRVSRKGASFQVSKAARRSISRSPAASIKGSRRTPAKPAPKTRLQHDDSQVQFEPIISSPTNPLDEASQDLTENQKETIKRQKLAANVFYNISTPSPQTNPPSNYDLNSDAPQIHDLPDLLPEATPTKPLITICNMDGFAGSSPTPHARRQVRPTAFDTIRYITPPVAQSTQLASDTDIRSSPPQFQNGSNSWTVSTLVDRQMPKSQSTPLEEETAVDEEARLHADSADLNVADQNEDTAMSGLTSPTLDLQVSAQIDADIQAHQAATTSLEGDDDSSSGSVDGATPNPTSLAPPQPSRDDATGLDDSQAAATHSTRSRLEEASDDGTVSTSRVDDSFIKSGLDIDKDEPQSLRRSSRTSAASQSTSIIKQTKSRQPSKLSSKKRSHKNGQGVETVVSDYQGAEDPTRDNVVVVCLKNGDESKKRKTSSNIRPSIEEVDGLPETRRCRITRRSQSLMRRMESLQDLIAKDEPPSKRSRQKVDQDVSGAKHSVESASRTRRISDVQGIPKQPPAANSTHEPSSKEETSKEMVPQVQSYSQTSQQTQEGATPSQAAPGLETPHRSFTERVILTPRSIINQLRNLKDYLFSTPQLVIGREEEREIDDALFDIRRRVHAAGQRADEHD